MTTPALAWLRTLADAEATVPARVVLDRLETELLDQDPPSAPAPAGAAVPFPSWRERVWTVPAQTRLSAEEAAEALGIAISTLYKRVCASAEDPLPSHRMGNRVVVLAGELRDWMKTDRSLAPPRPKPRKGQ